MTSVLSPAESLVAGQDRPRTPIGLAEVAVVLLGAVAGFAYLGRSSFHLDESVSASLATAPWHVFAHTVTHREANMVVYYLLLRVWVGFGRGEVAIRSLSVLCSLGVLLLVMAVGRRLFSRRAALVAGVLLAVDPVAVQFAQFARGYELSLLLATASSLLFVVAIRDPKRPWPWVGYVVVTAVAGYSNFWAVLVPVAHLASLALAGRGAVAWRKLVPSGVALAVLLVPLALLIRATDNAGVDWASQSSAGRVFSKIRDTVPHAAIDLAVVAGVVAVVVGAVAWGRRHPLPPSRSSWSWFFAACWLVVPIAVVVLVSVSYKPLLVARYLVVCVPPVALLVAAGLDRLSRRALAAAAIVLVVASVFGTAQWYDHGPGQDWRQATAAVSASARPGDGVMLFAPYVRIPFEWYLQQHPLARHQLRPVYPATPWETDPLRFDSNVPIDRAVVARAAAPYRRVWLVLSQQSLYPAQYHAVLSALSGDGLRPRRYQDFPGVEVVEYAAAGTSS